MPRGKYKRVYSACHFLSLSILRSLSCFSCELRNTCNSFTVDYIVIASAVRSRLDVAADDFWGRDRSRAYFDVRVFCPFAQSHRNTSLSQCYRKNELEKKRCYEQRIREIEHGSFSPLVFSTSGGMGPTATTVYKRIASMMAQKQDKPYSRTLHWIRCKLSYSLLRSAIRCLRGARSNIHQPASLVSSENMDGPRPTSVNTPSDTICVLSCFCLRSDTIQTSLMYNLNALR